MIQIVIKAKHLLRNRDYRGAELSLPAGKGEIFDALDRARVPYGSGEYQLFPDVETPGYIAKMLNNCGYNPSIAEMNHLAERMEPMGTDDLYKLEGIAEIRGSYDVLDIINATYNMDKFSFYPGIMDDVELGELAIEADDGFYPQLKDVPDELLDCLDRSKVGAILRRDDRGVFTETGYVIPESKEWDVAYDGNTMTERSIKLEPGDPIISLLLHANNNSREYGDEWLFCPASQKDIAAVLEKLEVKSLDECTIREAQSVIPVLGYAFSYGGDIEKINALAEAIKTHCGGELAKYKAAYEMENVTDIVTALRLAVRLKEYDFEPHPSTAEFGRAALEKTGMAVKLAGQYGFDFELYGATVMLENKIRLTPYGFISHPRGQDLSAQVKRGVSGQLMPETVHAIRNEYPPGTRVRLIRMEGEKDMPYGMTGLVDHVDDAAGVHVRWQNGSSLALLPDTDFFQKIDGQVMTMEEQAMEKPFEQTMG